MMERLAAHAFCLVVGLRLLLGRWGRFAPQTPRGYLEPGERPVGLSHPRAADDRIVAECVDVRPVSEEGDDGAGQDIANCSPEGRRRLIEDKPTNGWERTPFQTLRNDLTEERQSE